LIKLVDISVGALGTNGVPGCCVGKDPPRRRLLKKDRAEIEGRQIIDDADGHAGQNARSTASFATVVPRVTAIPEK
jgi:hypothetical protein